MRPPAIPIRHKKNRKAPKTIHHMRSRCHEVVLWFVLTVGSSRSGANVTSGSGGTKGDGRDCHSSSAPIARSKQPLLIPPSTPSPPRSCFARTAIQCAGARGLLTLLFAFSVKFSCYFFGTAFTWTHGRIVLHQGRVCLHGGRGPTGLEPGPVAAGRHGEAHRTNCDLRRSPSGTKTKQKSTMRSRCHEVVLWFVLTVGSSRSLN